MTTTASHSRWRLMQELERLAHGHDRADAALVRYAAASASASRRPVPERFDWWTIPALLTTAFVGWTSADALRTVTGGGVPFWVACLPGLALAVALIGMTVVAAAVARDAETRSDAVWPFVLSGVCVVGAAVWVTLWLDGIVRVARPVAFAAGVLFVVAVAAAAFGAVLYGGEPRTPGGPRT
ncbi:MAG: hypothetical protein ACRDNL_15660, partial [Spirillospora sp.]